VRVVPLRVGLGSILFAIIALLRTSDIFHQNEVANMCHSDSLDLPITETD